MQPVAGGSGGGAHRHGPEVPISLRLLSPEGGLPLTPAAPFAACDTGPAVRVAVYGGTLRSADLANLWHAHCDEGGGGSEVAPPSCGSPFPVAITARVEHVAWTWHTFQNASCNGDCTPAHPPANTVYSPTVLPPLTLELSAPPPPGQAAGSLPPCRGALAAAGGGWRAHGSAAGALGPSRHGLWWHGNGCALAPLSAGAAAQCLNARLNGTFLLLGDSNIRRAWKSLAGLSPSHGARAVLGALDAAAAASPHSAWCGWGRSGGSGNDRGSRVCICEDASEQGAFSARHGSEPTAAAYFGAATAVFDWLPGLTEPATWRAALARWAPGWSGKRPFLLETSGVSAVVFDLIHWDYTFLDLFENTNGQSAFGVELPAFAARLAATFPPPTRIIYRTPTFATREPNNWHPFKSLGRMTLFHEHTLAVLREALGARLEVWDVWGMTRARPLNHTLLQMDDCKPGHDSSEEVDAQVQLLLNGLCN